MANPFEPTAPYVQSIHYTWVDPAKPRFVSMLETHCMQSPDKPGTALGVADWFANKLAPKSPSPEASAHSCIDQTTIVCCVDPKDIAWACGAANHDTFSVELAGFADWTAADWLSETNTPMIGLAAEHFARAAKFFSLPLRTLTDDEVGQLLRDGCIRRGSVKGELSGVAGGVATHAQTNRVWKAWQLHGLPKPTGDLSHTDPGNGFPLDELVRMALIASTALVTQ